MIQLKRILKCDDCSDTKLSLISSFDMFIYEKYTDAFYRNNSLRTLNIRRVFGMNNFSWTELEFMRTGSQQILC